jgi:hypothetical protein
LCVFAGYWLGDGSIQYGRKSEVYVVFTPLKHADEAYLDALFARLPLKLFGTQRGKGQGGYTKNGTYVAAAAADARSSQSEASEAVAQCGRGDAGVAGCTNTEEHKTCEVDDEEMADAEAGAGSSSDGSQAESGARFHLVYLIREPAWGELFGAEYSHKYKNDTAERVAREAAEARGGAKWLAWWALRLSTRACRLMLRGLRFADGNQADELAGIQAAEKAVEGAEPAMPATESGRRREDLVAVQDGKIKAEGKTKDVADALGCTTKNVLRARRNRGKAAQHNIDYKDEWEEMTAKQKVCIKAASACMDARSACVVHACVCRAAC